MQPVQRGRLFCKPPDHLSSGRVLFEKETVAGAIAFRSLDLTSDLDMVFDWVNRAYAKQFWQLDGSRDLVYGTYYEILQNAATHSFIGLRNNQPVCQIDVYLLSVDELWKEVIDGGPNDCGFHLLMLPPKASSKGLAEMMLRSFFAFYFSFDQAERLFAEPDQKNQLANRLAMAVGLEFLYKVSLSYKQANLYSITKQQFYETHSLP